MKPLDKSSKDGLISVYIGYWIVKVRVHKWIFSPFEGRYFLSITFVGFAGCYPFTFSYHQMSLELWRSLLLLDDYVFGQPT